MDEKKFLGAVDEVLNGIAVYAREVWGLLDGKEVNSWDEIFSRIFQMEDDVTFIKDAIYRISPLRREHEEAFRMRLKKTLDVP